ncbi:hypothetical protein ABZS29_26780 [Kribbella sp. NPDC005582]|uniref:hypothetical protein n=1 Tax=Kribbella sp. NPDC005582 TaxID=3156893 RepID=UPI0033A2F7B9
MTDWIRTQVGLLRTQWPDLRYLAEPSGHWVLLPDWAMPHGWSIALVDVACQIPATPEQPPYAFYVNSPNLTFNGSQPGSWTPSAAVPFAGAWSVFSWAPEVWQPSAGSHLGPSMLTFARSFADRLGEGV